MGRAENVARQRQLTEERKQRDMLQQRKLQEDKASAELKRQLTAEIPAALKRLEAKDFPNSTVLTVRLWVIRPGGYLGPKIQRAGWKVHTYQVWNRDSNVECTVWLLSNGKLVTFTPWSYGEMQSVRKHDFSPAVLEGVKRLGR